MASTFDTKFEAILDRIPHPHSVTETPWKRAFLLVVFLIGAIVALLLFFIFSVLKEIFDKDRSTPPAEDDSPDTNGYKPGDFLYSEPGTINPIFLSMLEETDKTDGFG